MKQRFESSSGMIIGIIIAVLAVAAAIVLAVVFSRKKCPACVCTELMGTLGKKCINDKGDLMCMDGSVCLNVSDNEGVCVKCTADAGSDTCGKGGKCNTDTGKCVLDPASGGVGPVIPPMQK